MSKFYPTIVCNTGLGDFIVLSGAFVELARIHGGLRVPCLRPNFSSCKSILVHHPEIEIFIVENDQELRADFPADDPRNLHCYWTRVEGVINSPEISWDTYMYQQLNIDFKHRWNSCPIEAAAKEVAQISLPGSYYLIHEDLERGFIIHYPPFHPFIKSYRTFKTGHLSILAWTDVILRAKELHFIDSSFWHLAESLPLDPDQLLFIHRYARLRKPVWHDVHTRYHWKYLDS